MANFVKLFIKMQKTAARKSIAVNNTKISKTKTCNQYLMFKVIADERKFMEYDFSKVKSIDDVISIVHSLRHKSISKQNNYFKCDLCKNILAELQITPGADNQLKENDDSIKIKYGNLISILSDNLAAELAKIQGKRMPSQNDITRWAIKDAVLEFYKDFNESENTVVVDNVGDDRLSTKFEADFDVIYKKWIERLDRLKRRNDKYTLHADEFDSAVSDLDLGMRGSNFEKQLDRYRKEFMDQLNAINGNNF